MKYRKSSGELINDNSWVMRDLWDTSCTRKRFSYSSKETNLTWNQKIDGKSHLGTRSKEEARARKEAASLSSKPFFT
jgi:hypothetical protein